MEHSEDFPCRCAKDCLPCALFCSRAQFKRVSLAVIKALLSFDETCGRLSQQTDGVLWLL